MTGQPEVAHISGTWRVGAPRASSASGDPGTPAEPRARLPRDGGTPSCRATPPRARLAPAMTSPVAVLRPRILHAVQAPLRPPRPGSVERPRLVRRLRAGADAAVVALVAPAGYGKTTLLAEWEASDPRPFVWLPADGDPGRLLDDLPPSPYVLVLDDAHAVRRAADRSALATLVRHLAPGSQLALASRGAPGLALGRLRAQAELVELGAADLAMTEREAALLLRRAGVRLREAEVATIMRRTE